MSTPVIKRIETIKRSIEPLRQEIINHKIYSQIRSVSDLQVFMQYHVFAVWDFMSLLKALQNNLTCTTVPWFPVGSGDTRYLINEIVVGEESDIDAEGKRTSHFELYADAMKQCAADTSVIDSFIRNLRNTGDLNAALNDSGVPAEAAEFVRFTFRIIQSGKPHLQSAVFTFGREDLIPGMFLSMISELDTHFPRNISVFKYYIERHIEVDGGHHSQLAMEMTSNLCGDEETYWQEAEEAVVQSLKHRLALWDGVYRNLPSAQL